MKPTYTVIILANDKKHTFIGKLMADLNMDRADVIKDQLNAIFAEHGTKWFADIAPVEYTNL